MFILRLFDFYMQILAFGSDGVQKLWKWAGNEQNPNGKVLASLKQFHLVFFFLNNLCMSA